MKQIKFLGDKYFVPDWANFITQSKDGLIEVWKFQPEYYGDHWAYNEGTVPREHNYYVLQREHEMIFEEIM